MNAVATMTKKTREDAPEMEVTKIEKSLLDKARSALSWVKSRMPADTRKGYGLQNYLSDCLRGSHSLTDDYAAFIREEAKRLGKA